MLDEKKKEMIYIHASNAPATLGDSLIGLGVQLKTLPKGAKIAGIKIERDTRRLVIEFER